ncbi:MAG: rhodanese-like domain-containing protein [bacterium]|nr:rhodanese-like domain-containing protein [bacterium]
MRKLLALLLAMFIVVSFVGCSSDDDSDPTGPASVNPSANFTSVLNAMNSFIDTTSIVVSATTLEANLTNANWAILSVRSATHYSTNGHIPGAYNIPWQQVADTNQIALLNTITANKSKRLVVYCYTGHTGGLATGVLAALGYNTINLKYGMVGWTTDATARATTGFYTPGVTAIAGTVETTYNALSDYNAYPEPGVYAGYAGQSFIRQVAKNYLSTAAATVEARVVDSLRQTATPPFILDIRDSATYAAGHIPGARNIPFRDLNDAAKLRHLPPDRDIVLYCFTGHSGAEATAMLNLLGYKVKNLKFGYASWIDNPNYYNPAPVLRNVNTGINP